MGKTVMVKCNGGGNIIPCEAIMVEEERVWCSGTFEESSWARIIYGASGGLKVQLGLIHSFNYSRECGVKKNTKAEEIIMAVITEFEVLKNNEEATPIFDLCEILQRFA